MPVHKTVNKNFFKKWSKEMAYVLGFFLADGNIIKTKRGTHFVSFYSSDRVLIQLIKAILKSDHKISKQSGIKGSCFRLQIGSKEIFSDLINLGVTPNKSKRMLLPKSPAKFISHLIRGYFDGDGNVWSGVLNKHRKNPTKNIFVVFTSANLNFLSQLLGELRKKGIRGGSLFRARNGNYGRLSLSTLDALKLYEIMYNDPDRLYLKRKKLVFEKFIKVRA